MAVLQYEQPIKVRRRCSWLTNHLFPFSHISPRFHWSLGEFSLKPRRHFNCVSSSFQSFLLDNPLIRRWETNGLFLTSQWNADDKPLNRFERSQDSLWVNASNAPSKKDICSQKKVFLEKTSPAWNPLYIGLSALLGEVVRFVSLLPQNRKS